MDNKIQCFRCEKLIDIQHDCPNGGVMFTGGDRYGSTLYDSMIDGIHVSLVICDDCLKNNQENLEEFKIKEIPNEYKVIKKFGEVYKAKEK